MLTDVDRGGTGSELRWTSEKNYEIPRFTQVCFHVAKNIEYNF